MNGRRPVSDGRLIEEELVPDAAVKEQQDDDLNHDAVAEVISDLVRQVRAPANIAIFGPWGSGKSSIYGMVEARLRAEAPDVAIVRYDAWKFGGRQLQRNFLMHVADTLKISHDRYLSNLTSGVETTRLKLGRFLWKNRWSLLGAVLIALSTAAVWLTISAEAAVRVGSAERTTEYLRAMPSAAIVFGAVIGGLLLSNQALASATEKRQRSPLQDADQFSLAFRDLVNAVITENWVNAIVRTRSKKPIKKRLVVFIDELDRCAPTDVVVTLTNIKTFLDNDSCVFVVAADRDALESALEETPQAKPLRESEPYYSTAGAFIDKIFQHQISLPPVRPEALTYFAKSLANKRGGLWEELRKDQRAYEDVVYSLVPAHVQSPRRVKVLMNNFVTNCRVIQARGLAWRDRATEIAVLTVLQTEFPTVVKDMLRQPRLLEAMTGHLEKLSPELEDLVASYRPSDSAGDQSHPETALIRAKRIVSPSGPIYADPTTGDDDKKNAQLLLNALLESYLGKIHAAGIDLPSPELIYLQQAAHVDGLEDSTLARNLDFAADTDPSALASAFDTATTKDRQAAIRALIARASSNVLGPSRANLIEAACRIAEGFDDLTDVEAVAGQAAGTVLAEARKGRWRKEATPGALILGLLDPNISHPIAALGDQASAAQLARDGLFDRLLPLLSHLNDARAEEINELLGVAYADHPEAMHAALRTLPDHTATRLWNSQEERVRTTIEALPESADETTVSAEMATASSRGQAPPEPEEPAETSAERYTALLGAIAQRGGPSSAVGSRALLLGMRSEHDRLYNVAWEARTNVLDGIVPDHDARNTVVLDATSYCPDEHLDGWLSYLDTDGRKIVSSDVAKGVTRLLNDLKQRDIEHLRSLPGQLQPLAGWASNELAAEAADMIVDVLKTTPFDEEADPDGTRRTTSYALLRLFEEQLAVDRINKIRADDVQASVASQPMTMNAVAQMREQIAVLDKTHAANLDDALSRQRSSDSSKHLGLARLRVAARITAGRGSLRVASFESLLNDQEPSAALLSEWLATKPPLSQVERAIKKSCVGQRALSQYAKTRHAADRSKLWIVLLDAHYSRDHLGAVGRHGVNNTVIAHLEQRIINADLETQKALVGDLLTANLSMDPGTRTAATKLAMRLLKSGVVGAGPHAAQIVVAAKGPGPGQKAALRKAFDTYTSVNPKKLSRFLTRSLDDMGLLTRRKSTPLASILGWFHSSDD